MDTPPFGHEFVRVIYRRPIGVPSARRGFQIGCNPTSESALRSCEAMVVPCRFRTLRTLEVFEREGPERHRDALSVDESPSANPGLSQKMQLSFERKEMGGWLDHFFFRGVHTILRQALEAMPQTFMLTLLLVVTGTGLA